MNNLIHRWAVKSFWHSSFWILIASSSILSAVIQSWFISFQMNTRSLPWLSKQYSRAIENTVKHWSLVIFNTRCVSSGLRCQDDLNEAAIPDMSLHLGWLGCLGWVWKLIISDHLDHIRPPLGRYCAACSDWPGAPAGEYDIMNYDIFTIHVFII